MKSLFYKEFLLMKKTWILFYALFMALFAVVNVILAAETSFIWCIVSVVVGFALPTGFLNNDTTFGFSRFVETMPVKKSHVVLQKFILGIVVWIFSLLLVGLFFLSNYISSPESFLAKEYLVLLWTSAFGSIAFSIAMPFAFRFGAPYAMLVQIGVNGFVVGFFVGFVSISKMDDLLSFCGKPMNILIIFAVSVLCYFISYRWSVKIYDKHGAK